MLMWHKKGEQRTIETSKQKTHIQAQHKITESATQTHTHRHKQKTTQHFAKINTPSRSRDRDRDCDAVALRGRWYQRSG
jgi:hypothetical protein